MVDKKTGFDQFEEGVLEDILAASDDEILDEAREAGDDPEAYAARMREWLRAAKVDAGKKRLAQARQELERDRQNAASNVTRLRAPSTNRPTNGFVPDTMAARLEKGDQSDRDKKFEDDDFDELFDDEAWKDDESN